MSMIVNFCYDDLGPNPDLGYPNLAMPNLSPDEFDTTWPRVLPLRLLMYLQQFGHKFIAHQVSNCPIGSWYPIALAWHDFECDYFDLMSDMAKARARAGEIKFLFYYHEGDHPGRIKDRFDYLCHQHSLPRSCYLFVSANTSADRYENFRYFNDHEYFLSYINRNQSVCDITEDPRPYNFTALNRIHKWWRSSIMADLKNQGILENSFWSYNTNCVIGDLPEDNPLMLDSLPDWKKQVDDFVQHGPYVCDDLDSSQQNDHRHINTDLYTKSYCHLIIETLYDVDQSGGSFMTEKTYKCFKFGQPFVMIGPAGSLKTLREAGYRVFDHAIDNDYDLIEDNTERWMATRETIKKIHLGNMHEWYLNCVEDIKHNQWNFQTKSHGNLDALVKILTTDFNTVE